MARVTTVGDRLRARQRELGLDHAHAAQAIGVDRSVYGRWVSERKVMLPSPKNCPRVAAYLGISLEELVEMLPSSYHVVGVDHDLASLKRDLAELAFKHAALRDAVLELVTIIDPRVTVDASLLARLRADMVGDVHLVS